MPSQFLSPPIHPPKAAATPTSKNPTRAMIKPAVRRLKLTALAQCHGMRVHGDERYLRAAALP